MVLNRLRHLLPLITNGPINLCIKLKITPNQLTIIGFVISAIAGISFAFPVNFLYNWTQITPNLWWWWACVPPWLFFISGYIDLLDGGVARKTNTITKYGAFLDSTLDRIADSFAVLGLMIGQMLWPWNSMINTLIGMSSLIVMLLISYVRSRAELEGVVMRGIGFMERAERMLILIAFYAIEWGVFAIQVKGFQVDPSLTWHIFPYLYLAYTLLCLQTLIARIIWAWKWLTNRIPENVRTELMNPASHG
jgi:phosphatidylglycerophosphate synthase